MSRGDRREEIFRDDVDRQDFLKTLAETCQKSGFEVHAHGLMLERREGELGEEPAGDLRRESAEVRAGRIVAEELRRQGWREADPAQRRKGDAVKLGLAARLRRAFAAPKRLRPRGRETTLTGGGIAARLKMGTRQSTATRLQEFKRQRKAGSGKGCQTAQCHGLIPHPASTRPESKEENLEWPDFAQRLAKHYPVPAVGPTATELLAQDKEDRF